MGSSIKKYIAIEIERTLIVLRFSLFLKFVSPLFVAAGLLHGLFGLGADNLLGAGLSSIEISNPSLDSNNRFYGIAFMAYGLLLFYCARDLRKYKNIIFILLWVLFIAGSSRLISWFFNGAPKPLVILLMLSELAAVFAIYWFKRVLGTSMTASKENLNGH